jgi:vacuolar-type H+-ATPase subunit I/STV1
MVETVDVVDLESQPVVPGFRKGVTKKSIVKSLKDEDWLHLEKLKEAEEREANPAAYNVFLKSDQAVHAKNQLQYNVEEHVLAVEQLASAIKDNEIRVLAGDFPKDSEGNKLSTEDVRISTDKWRIKQLRTLDLIRGDLSRLYTFCGRLGFDRKVFYTEEEWNEFHNNVQKRLEQAGLEL